MSNPYEPPDPTGTGLVFNRIRSPTTAAANPSSRKCVGLRIGSYRRFVDDSRTALVEFAEAVERLKEGQYRREQQLEQPSEIGQLHV